MSETDSGVLDRPKKINLKNLVLQRSKNQCKLVKVSSLPPPATLNKYYSTLKLTADIHTISNFTEPDLTKRRERFGDPVKNNAHRCLNATQKIVLESFYNKISKYPTAEDFKKLSLQVIITFFMISKYLTKCL